MIKLLQKNLNRIVTIKVINKVCGRVDYHKNITKEDILWIACNPNLEIEILEQSEDGG